MTGKGIAQEDGEARSCYSGVVFWIVIAAVVASLLVGIVLFLLRVDTGTPVYGEDGVPEVLEAAIVLAEYYQDLTKLFMASFGVAAFLITYRQKSATEITSRSWYLLGAGIGLLGVALVLVLIGSDALITMLSRNAVELNALGLRVTRWGAYGLLVVAAVCISFYAAEVLPRTSSK